METIIDDIKKVGWNTEKLIIDSKADGLRVTFGKISGKGFIYVDPEGLKRKSPNVSKRLIGLANEIERSLPDDSIFDGEFIAIVKDEVAHRTVANSLLNAVKEITPEELSEYACIFSFTPLYFKGDDVRTYPLKERIELINQVKDTDHIFFERPSTKLVPDRLGYVIDGSKDNDIKKAIKLILDNKKYPYIAEGCMVKLLNHKYDYPTHHGWAKSKKLLESDLVVFDRHQVKGSPGVFNYHLGVDISKEYYDKLPNNRKANIGNRYLMYFGKSDNHKGKYDNGSIIRVASEEILREENKEFPDYPVYRGYISVILEEIPEKNISDKLEVFEKLSRLQPKRISIADLKRIKAEVEKAESIKEDVLISKKEGKIPKEIYEKYAKDNESLPKEFYKKPLKGTFFCQHHVRGILPEEKEAFDKKKKSLADILIGHSVHTDDRMDFEDGQKLKQWVFTDNKIQDLVKMYKGEGRKVKGDKIAIQHSMAIVKPSAEEPSKIIKEEKEPLIDKEGAKLIVDLDLKNKSYWIPPGAIGATKDTWSYMSCFVIGKVEAGVQREDCHEYFYHPTLCKDDKILDGRFMVKCLKRPDRSARWEVWMCRDNPLPLDPIEHKDQGTYWPVPAGKVKKFGKEAYK